MAANAHAVFARFYTKNSEIFFIDSAAIAASKGLCFNLIWDKDHAVQLSSRALKHEI